MIVTSNRGIWIDGRKISFVGLGFRKWISLHGISLNIINDISDFSSIIPCGNKDERITNVREETGDNALSFETEKNIIKELFEKSL